MHYVIFAQKPRSYYLTDAEADKTVSVSTEGGPQPADTLSVLLRVLQPPPRFCLTQQTLWSGRIRSLHQYEGIPYQLHRDGSRTGEIPPAARQFYLTRYLLKPRLQF
jgi:hypothetical protein